MHVEIQVKIHIFRIQLSASKCSVGNHAEQRLKLFWLLHQMLAIPTSVIFTVNHHMLKYKHKFNTNSNTNTITHTNTNIDTAASKACHSDVFTVNHQMPNTIYQ